VTDSGVSGYVLKLPCWHTDVPVAAGQSPTATLQSNQTLTWNLGYTLPGPWFQAGGGGDVYAANTIQPLVPDTATHRVFSLRDTDNSTGTLGIVTYGTSFDVGAGAGSKRNRAGLPHRMNLLVL